MEHSKTCTHKGSSARNGNLSRAGIDGEAISDSNASSLSGNAATVARPEYAEESRSSLRRLKNAGNDRLVDLAQHYEADSDWEPERTGKALTHVVPQPGRRCNINSSDFGGWQGQFPTIKSRLAFLYNNELMSDVTFLVGRQPTQQRFYAHKFVLAIGSSVFHVMFFGTMAEHQRQNKSVSSEIEAAVSSSTFSFELVAPNVHNLSADRPSRAGADEIEIDDVEPAAFDTLLRLLYTDSAEITHHFVMSTLYLAKKYSVPALERLCVDFLQTNLSPDNAFLLLTQARLFDEQQLVEKCLDSIDQRTVESLDTDYFTEIGLDTLCIVLERDSLQVRESKLFSAVLQWAQHECMRQNLPATGENQRHALGRAIHMLRFPIMTLEEFANGPAQSGILTDAELVKLFLHFTVNPKPDVPFLDVPRNCYTGKEHVVSRFQRTDRRWGYSSAADCIRMSVSRPVFVVGFGLYGSCMNSADYAVTMEIVEISKQRKLAEHKTNFSSDGSQTPHRPRLEPVLSNFALHSVLFPKPVGLQADHQYLLSVFMKGPDSYYGTGGQTTISQDCGNEGVVKINFFYSHGSNNGTSVEDGQIPEIIFYLCGPNSFNGPDLDSSDRSSKRNVVEGKSGGSVSNAGTSALSSSLGQKASNNTAGGSHSNRSFVSSIRESGSNSWNNSANAYNLLPAASPAAEELGGALIF